jgi:hypothetical protein
LEYPDVEQRQRELARLIGVEDRVWVRVEGFDPVWAIADEDLERENSVKTSSVHFLRFELSPPMIAALKRGAALGAGIDHPAYRHEVSPAPEAVRRALVADLA